MLNSAGALTFRLLGPVTVTREGADVPLSGTKIHTVLAVLLMARGTHVADSRLTAALWGDTPPPTSNSQIYTYVSRLRKTLGNCARIFRKGPGYVLEVREADVDLFSFERLDRLGREALEQNRPEEAGRLLGGALDLWSGQALENVTEHLLRHERPRLEYRRTQALERRIEADLSLGRHRALVPELLALVARFPLDETLRAHLVTALHRSDRQAEAVQVYDEGRRVLADQLGVVPGRRLSEAYLHMLRGDITHPLPVRLPPRPATFTGRTAEAGRLRSLLLSRPRLRAALITGAPGSGKTALAVEVAHGCVEAFPDGVVLLGLRDEDGAGRTTAAVLREILAALGEGKGTGAGEGERAGPGGPAQAGGSGLGGPLHAGGPGLGLGGPVQGSGSGPDGPVHAGGLGLGGLVDAGGLGLGGPVAAGGPGVGGLVCGGGFGSGGPVQAGGLGLGGLVCGGGSGAGGPVQAGGFGLGGSAAAGGPGVGGLVCGGGSGAGEPADAGGLGSGWSAYAGGAGVGRVVCPGRPELRDLVRRYRARLARARILLVLDDVVSDSQLAALLPVGLDSALLVTSRGRLVAVPAAHTLTLGPLDDEDAVRLLADIAGADRVRAEPGAVRELVRHCAGLPSALSAAGARLAERPRLGVARLAARFTEPRTRLAALKRDGRATPARLGPIARALVLKLAADGPGLLPALLAAAPPGATESDARHALTELVDAGLVITQTGTRPGTQADAHPGTRPDTQPRPPLDARPAPQPGEPHPRLHPLLLLSADTPLPRRQPRPRQTTQGR
ncbi:AfsR/SARP family transcriptional regulator [Streptomyces sp. 4F14]|uniref:AfsR/SARP family transcriptional regulator n=1 Tax=Streptomyces sp. 4F14 TaxID=3394380 RepID=UPI003A83BF0C